jgi:hypothetical protein
MDKTKLMAGSLFFCSIAVIIGFILDKEIYWYAVDVAVILICTVNAMMLLKNK